MDHLVECPFCTSGIQKYIIASSGLFHAVCNKAPILPGHTLIIPKRHVCSLFELSPAESNEFFRYAASMTKVLLSTFSSQAFNWSIQEGDTAGQTVNHLHLHILVRQPFDLTQPGGWYSELYPAATKCLESKIRPEITEEDLNNTIARLKQHIAWL